VLKIVKRGLAVICELLQIGVFLILLPIDYAGIKLRRVAARLTRHPYYWLVQSKRLLRGEPTWQEHDWKIGIPPPGWKPVPCDIREFAQKARGEVVEEKEEKMDASDNPMKPRFCANCGEIVSWNYPSGDETCAEVACQHCGAGYDICFDGCSVRAGRQRDEKDAKLGRELVALLSEVVGDSGVSEGAVDCLKRQIADRKAFALALREVDQFMFAACMLCHRKHAQDCPFHRAMAIYIR